MEKEKGRVRAPNYTRSEKERLLFLVEHQKPIIENKKTDMVSSEEKKTAWEKVAKEFNASSPSMIHRTVDSLKKYYINQKEELRKRLANEKKEIYLTGGGPPPPPPERDEADKMLLNLINEKTLYGVEKSIAPYDDDYVENYEENDVCETHVWKAAQQKSMRKSMLDETTKDAFSKDAEQYLPSSAIQLLKSPLDPLLKESGSKVQDIMDLTNIEIIVDDNIDSSFTLDNSATKGEKLTDQPTAKRIRKSVKVTSNSGRKQTVLPTARRRPQLIRTVTSSRLGELYETLIEKKLVLVEGLEKEHEVRLHILETEKKIKDAELNRVMNRIQSDPQKVSVLPLDVDTLIGESVEWNL